MSIQPKEIPQTNRWLMAGKEASGLSVNEIWFRYRMAGGTNKHPSIKSYLLGKTEPKVSDYLILAAVLNERLREAGREDARIPTFEAPNTTLGEDVRLA